MAPEWIPAQTCHVSQQRKGRARRAERMLLDKLVSEGSRFSSAGCSACRRNLSRGAVLIGCLLCRGFAHFTKATLASLLPSVATAGESSEF